MNGTTANIALAHVRAKVSQSALDVWGFRGCFRSGEWEIRAALRAACLGSWISTGRGDFKSSSMDKHGVEEMLRGEVRIRD